MYGNHPSTIGHALASRDSVDLDLPSNLPELADQFRNAMYEVRSFRSRLERKNMQLISAPPVPPSPFPESDADLRVKQPLISELNEIATQLWSELSKLSETISTTETI